MLILFTSEISACLFSDRPPVFEVPPLGEEGSRYRVLSSGLLEDGANRGTMGQCPIGLGCSPTLLLTSCVILRQVI